MPSDRIALPVVASGPPRRRRGHSRLRWIVLLTVQGLMLLHIAQWLVTGVTTTPIEPSEAMQVVDRGVINVGAIFFALALLSTALFGRWMCGWMCHVVLLQDGCAWLLRRIGLRPAPFRSRLLMLLPLVLALYMFVWPAVYRLAVAPVTRPELEWPAWQVQLVTQDFWRTFPGLLVGVPFLLVCGFLTVYLLGQKGYCTYGCPYGGFFAPLDELAPLRIRVTTDCEQCGHCTAVCTSNVRVHEEVRDFGMVVDPGCMKCLDCVSVCPKDALYVGFGAPAVRKTPRTEAPRTRRFDLSWPEEIAFALLATLFLVAIRCGMFGDVPLLFASGIVICAVWLAWKAWRTVRDRNARLHGLALRKGGRWRPAGVVLVALVAGLVLVALDATVAAGARFVAIRLDDRVSVSAQAVFGAAPPELSPAMRRDAERAARLYRLASTVGDGGIALGQAWQPGIDIRQAWLLAAQQRWPEAEAVLRRSVQRHGDSEAAHAGIARLRRAQLDDHGSFDHARTVLERHPEYVALFDETAAAMTEAGDTAGAIDLARATLARRPGELNVMRRLSLLLTEHGDAAQLDEGIALIEETLRLAPGNPYAHYALALGLGRRGDLDAAERELRTAVGLAPDNALLQRAMGELLSGTGRADEARPFLERATEIERGRR